VVFEDMHWADASTRDLVAFLARGLLSELERSSVVDRVDVGA